MKIFSIVLLLSTLFTGCVAKRDISGKYMNSVFGSIEFYNDSTYYFEKSTYNLFSYSSGAWKKSASNFLVFSSDVKNVAAPLLLENYELSEGANYNSIKITPYLSDLDSLQDYQCYIFLDDEYYKKVRCDSLADMYVSKHFNDIYFKIAKEPLLSMTTAISKPLTTEKFTVSSTSGNIMSFKLFIENYKFFYEHFDNYVLKVGKKNLFFLDPYHNKWCRIKRMDKQKNIFSSFGKSFRRNPLKIE
ncbi:hypothetical protein [Sphingobacterium griseoflavum]|uniref:Lipoprotein n=1 Tax=Sphingobacterium griseoflavum TaxID=1474952 RepID=A0ABQ3HZ42_9SPHI|nr:hypothetical protein [Sphingobacterium griseoflavum]GHE33678.1 hypothetical protein GCM10017764_16110 [Sphingobacterium griseoflavum]